MNTIPVPSRSGFIPALRSSIRVSPDIGALGARKKDIVVPAFVKWLIGILRYVLRYVSVTLVTVAITLGFVDHRDHIVEIYAAGIAAFVCSIAFSRVYPRIHRRR